MEREMQREYVALDTETYKGRAFLVSWATGVEPVKKFSDFMNLACRLGEKFVTYNVMYDVSALLALLPQKFWQKLFIEQVAGNGKDLWMKLLSRKLWIVRSGDYRFEMYDLWPFFQCGLGDALKKFGAPASLQKRKISKNLLRNLSPENYRKHRKEIDHYAQADAAGLQWLCDELLQTLKDIGLETDALYGVGFFAKKYLKKNGVNFGKLPGRYAEFVDKCYYGARIEVLKRGHWQKAYGYDIRSAYPSGLAKLPDFSKAKYYYSRYPETKWFFAECMVKMKESSFYLLPYRYKETIIFPRYDGQRTWLTSLEADYLFRHGLAEIEFVKTLNIKVGGRKPYVRLVKKLYKMRKLGGMKKQVFKLILNSLYGVAAEKIDHYKRVELDDAVYSYLRLLRRNEYKAFVLAQSRRCKEAKRFWAKACSCQVCNDTRKVMRFMPHSSKKHHELLGEFYRMYRRDGRMANKAVAAFVTAGARVKIFDAMRKAGNATLCVFTDCIYTTKKIDMNLQEKLGAWEFQGCKPMTIIGSGVYQFGKKVKFRGFGFKGSLNDVLKKASTAFVSISQIFRVSGMRKIRHKIKTADFSLNELIEDEKILHLNFDHKRRWCDKFRSGREVFAKKISSLPFSLSDL